MVMEGFLFLLCVRQFQTWFPGGGETSLTPSTKVLLHAFAYTHDYLGALYSVMGNNDKLPLYILTQEIVFGTFRHSRK